MRIVSAVVEAVVAIGAAFSLVGILMGSLWSKPLLFLCGAVLILDVLLGRDSIVKGRWRRLAADYPALNS